jgi:hypothetical protein
MWAGFLETAAILDILDYQAILATIPARQVIQVILVQEQSVILVTVGQVVILATAVLVHLDILDIAGRGIADTLDLGYLVILDIAGKGTAVILDILDNLGIAVILAYQVIQDIVAKADIQVILDTVEWVIADTAGTTYLGILDILAPLEVQD